MQLFCRKNGIKVKIIAFFSKIIWLFEKKAVILRDFSCFIARNNNKI